MNLPPVHTKKVNPLIHPLDIRVKKLCGFKIFGLVKKGPWSRIISVEIYRG